MHSIQTYIGSANDVVMLDSNNCRCSMIKIDIPIYNYEGKLDNTSFRIERIMRMIEHG